MTVDLPPKYSELDIDYDGQIGLYEWITARRESLAPVRSDGHEL